MAGAVQRGINPIYLRHEVAYDGPQRPGTIVIDTPNKFLYLVQPSGRAIRYGIGVGRPGFMWSGVKQVSRKAEDAAAGNAEVPPRSAAPHGGRPG